jgi:hypothetical protein
MDGLCEVRLTIVLRDVFRKVGKAMLTEDPAKIFEGRHRPKPA